MRERERSEAPIVATLLWPESGIEIDHGVLPKYLLKMRPENLMRSPLNVNGASNFGEHIRCEVCREKSSTPEETSEEEKNHRCRQLTLCLDLMYSKLNASAKLEDAKM